MIRGITVYRNQVVDVLFRAAQLFPIAGIMLYLLLVSAVILPVAIGCSIVLAPVIYTTHFVKHKRYIPLLIRAAGHLENLGQFIVHSRKSMAGFMIGLIKSMKWHWPLS